MSKTLEFYFDFGSPTAYLAHKRLGQLGRQYGLEVRYIPMLLGGVFKALEGEETSQDRRYTEAEAGVRWTMAPDWSLHVAYQYRYQKYDVVPDEAQSNGVFVAVIWTPLRPN